MRNDDAERAWQSAADFSEAGGSRAIGNHQCGSNDKELCPWAAARVGNGPPALGGWKWFERGGCRKPVELKLRCVGQLLLRAPPGASSEHAPHPLGRQRGCLES